MALYFASAHIDFDFFEIIFCSDVIHAVRNTISTPRLPRTPNRFHAAATTACRRAFALQSFTLSVSTGPPAGFDGDCY
jgi:hypothetical protein